MGLAYLSISSFGVVENFCILVLPLLSSSTVHLGALVQHWRICLFGLVKFWSWLYGVWHMSYFLFCPVGKELYAMSDVT
jgi:hypothetical protein